MPYPVKPLTHTRAHLAFAGVVDELGRELTHAHLREAVHDILGRPLVKLIQHLGSDHPDTQDAFHARVSGHWHIDRYNAPLEYYAARASRGALVEVSEVQLDADPTWPTRYPKLFQAALVAIARNEHNDSSDFADDPSLDNLFTTLGIDLLWVGVTQASVGAANTGGSPAASNAILNATQARIGAGDNATGGSGTQQVALATDVDLNTIANGNSGTTHATWQVVSTAPTVSTNNITFSASYGSTFGNFAWNELATDNCGGSNATTATRSGGTMLDHLISGQGTKAGGMTWVPTFTLLVN